VLDLCRIEKTPLAENAQLTYMFCRFCRVGAPLRWRALSSTGGAEKVVKAADAGGGTTHFGFREVDRQEKAQMVGGVFHSVAESYDVMNDLMSGGMHRVWKDWFVDELGPMAAQNGAPPLRILDVAGGTGDIAIRHLEAAAASASSGGESAAALPHVTVFDINSSMLRVGEERAQAAKPHLLPQLAWVEGDAMALPFEDNTFDAYTIAFGIRNVTDIPMALREAHRVLRRGGRFLCLEFSQVPNATLQRVYDEYSFNVIPKIGEVVANDRDSYQYLVESIRQFPRQDDFEAMIGEAGFAYTQYTNYTGGIVAAHSGFKL